MDDLTSAIHMLRKNLNKLQQRNSSDNFINGYKKAIKDVEWLKNKIEKDNANKICNKYFISSGKLGSSE